MTGTPTTRHHRHRGEREGILASILLVLALLGHLLASGGPAHAASPDLVISQIYGGGGLSNATYNRDFVELFHPGIGDVTLDGWSVQYRPPMGGSWSVTALPATTLRPGQRFLLGLGQPGSGMELPTTDASGSLGIDAGSGTVALVRSRAPVSGCPPPSDPVVADLVGYGSAGCSETAAARSGSATTAVIRQGGACVDTDNNEADFAQAAPQPQNSSDIRTPCFTEEAVLTRAATPTGGPAPLTVTFDYTVEHVGNLPISEVVVTDDRCAPVLPAGGDADNDGILGNSETWTYRCRATFTQAGTYVSTASATGTMSGGTVDINTSQVTVRVTDPRPTLAVAATPTDGRAPLAVHYTYTAGNSGTDPVGTVAVSDDSCSPVTLRSGDANGNALLEPGEVWTYTCDRVVSEPGAISSTATLTSVDLVDGQPAPPAAAHVAVTVRRPHTTLSVAASPSDSAAPVDVTYTYVHTNDGTDQITGASVTDDTCSPLVRTGGDTDSDGIFDPGERWSYSCSRTFTTPGTYTSTATGGGTDAIDGQAVPPATAQATVNVRSSAADVAVSMAANPNPVRTGTNLTYSLTVKNVGPDGARDVRVTDALPPGTQFVSATQSQGSCVTPARGASGTVVCSLGTVPSGGAASIELVVKVVTPGKDRVTNTATVQTSIHDPQPANNSVTVDTATFGRR